MSKRLQVVLDEQELREIETAARRERMTTSEWVRQALRAARRARAGGDAGKKLALVRRAARHGFPTRDIDQMLGEIERGRTGDAS
jgi:metal-responsive CopG/Arc/MetJ family transcriptional regulator